MGVVPDIPSVSVGSLCDHCQAPNTPWWTEYINPCWLACEAVLQTYQGLAEGINRGIIPLVNDVLDPVADEAQKLWSECSGLIDTLRTAKEDVVWLTDHVPELLKLTNPKYAWKYLVAWVQSVLRVEVEIASIVLGAVGVVLTTASLGGFIFWIRLIL